MKLYLYNSIGRSSTSGLSVKITYDGAYYYYSTIYCRTMKLNSIKTIDIDNSFIKLATHRI